VSGDLPDLDLTELADPALNGLVRALTADGTAGELAGRPAALAMFRDSRRRPRRRWFAVSLSSAAAAVVLAGGIGAAYAAVLPGPVQHIAYRMLGSIGVPDAHRPAPSSEPSTSGARSSGAPHLATTAPPPTHPASAPAGCPCPSRSPGPAAAPNLTLAATLTRIPANAGDVFTGRLAVRGRPEAGVRLRLSEQAGNGGGWQSAGSAVTDRSGEVTLTVVHLTSNASFRLAAPGGAVSRPVLVTVIPPVYVAVIPGRLAGVDRVTVWAPSAQAGDTVVLQELSGGVWHRVGARVLGRYHLASFPVLVPLSGHVEYRVVLPATAAHGWSASRRVRVAAEPGLSAAVASTEQ